MRFNTENITEFIAIFIINLMIFFISKFFAEISIIQCFIFSVINTVWMKFLLLPLLKNNQKKENDLKFKENLKNYFDEFEKRQKLLNTKFKEEENEIEKLNEINKYDWKLFRKHLRDNKIDCLYHFTDKSNIDSIKLNKGIFSWKYCEDNKIKINRPGGNMLSRNLDIRNNLENYARLSFVKNHPMLYKAINDGRIKEPIILEIDIDVVFLKQTLFSNKNANKNNANIGKEFISLSEINFEVIKSEYNSLDETLKDYFQSEVLIKDKIDIQYIKNLN